MPGTTKRVLAIGLLVAVWLVATFGISLAVVEWRGANSQSEEVEALAAELRTHDTRIEGLATRVSDIGEVRALSEVAQSDDICDLARTLYFAEIRLALVFDFVLGSDSTSGEPEPDWFVEFC